MYFPDLSPYGYVGKPEPNVLNVGWLQRGMPYATGEVDPLFVLALRRLADHPVNLCRGHHICDLGSGGCRDVDFYSGGNGEIRVSAACCTYAAPRLIVHYIEKHLYLPPQSFIDAVLAVPL